jgi:hypothetical protein
MAASALGSLPARYFADSSRSCASVGAGMPAGHSLSTWSRIVPRSSSAASVSTRASSSPDQWRRPAEPPRIAVRNRSATQRQELRDDVRAQRVAEDVRLVDLQVVEQPHDVEAHLAPVARRIVRLAALAVTAQVEADHAVALRERTAKPVRTNWLSNVPV